MRDGEPVVRVQVPVHLAEDGRVSDGALNGQTFFLIARRADEINQGEALAIRVAVDERFVGQDGRSL